MAKTNTRPTEAWVETKAEITFGADEESFWIRVGPRYDEAMVIRLHGHWPKDLHESLGRYLKGTPFREVDEEE